MLADVVADLEAKLSSKADLELVVRTELWVALADRLRVPGKDQLPVCAGKGRMRGREIAYGFRPPLVPTP